MKDYNINDKLNLLIKNYNELSKVKGSWQMGMIQHSCALSFTLKGKSINSKLVEDRIQIIKDNTSLISSFRGYNLFYMATLLSFESNPTNSFNKILKIYEELKSEKFFGDAYLPLAAIIIYENRDKIDVISCVSRMKYIYKSMKKNHPFLTSSDDYCNAAIMAIYSKDLDKDLEQIEESYKFLNKNGFYKGDGLQAVSQILSFSEDKSTAKCKKVVVLREALNDNDCKMYGYGYPIIGAISLLDYDENILVNQIKNVCEELKSVKGYGNWSLGKTNRTMISASLIASTYAKELNDNNDLDSITDNIFTNIVIAIEMACMMAAISAAIAASSAN